MGMAASQARLLSITARLSNNEQSSESIAYSKQRLADQTHQITNEYNEALDATKLTVLTGFNGAVANYEDISYGLMTGKQMAESTRQYVVTDVKGRILVTEAIADAYRKSNGNYNQFLANLGEKDDGGPYSQSDITVQKNSEDEAAKAQTEQKIHEAWDKYFASVGINKFMPEHDFGFSFTETYAYGTDGTSDDDYNIGDGYVGFIRAQKDENGNIVYGYLTNDAGEYVDSKGDVIEKDAYTEDTIANAPTVKYYNEDDEEVDKNSPDMVYCKCFDELGQEIAPDAYTDIAMGNFVETPIYLDAEGNEFTTSIEKDPRFVYDPINYEGTTQESRDLYDYAMAITEAYLRVPGTSESGVSFNKTFNMDEIKTAANSENNNTLKYYKNIFNKIQSNGYFTYTDTPSKSTDKVYGEHYIYSETTKGTGKVNKNPLKDNYTFEAALRDGSLRLQFFSNTEKTFKSTTISEDNCIQEVRDERAIAKAETKYNQDMADLENKDKKFDLELKKLDTEHKALETEYESVKNVVDKNVESTFKIFS